MKYIVFNKKSCLPGDSAFLKERERLLRVNHAGELAAKYIYKGQIAVLKNDPISFSLYDMLNEEKKHLDYFQMTLKKNYIRPSFLSPLWSVLGFALGVATASFGKKTAMACTIAVEETIDKHYYLQELFLKKEKKDLELLQKIEQFRKEEQEHCDIAINYGGKRIPFYFLLSKFIKFGSKISIKLAKRI